MIFFFIGESIVSVCLFFKLVRFQTFTWPAKKISTQNSHLYIESKKRSLTKAS
jgi:hypothetical protein